MNGVTLECTCLPLQRVESWDGNVGHVRLRDPDCELCKKIAEAELTFAKVTDDERYLFRGTPETGGHVLEGRKIPGTGGKLLVDDLDEVREANTPEEKEAVAKLWSTPSTGTARVYSMRHPEDALHGKFDTREPPGLRQIPRTASKIDGTNDFDLDVPLARRMVTYPKNPAQLEKVIPARFKGGKLLDACEVCKGERGGEPGNENIIDGVTMCDYCHAHSSATHATHHQSHFECVLCNRCVCSTCELELAPPGEAGRWPTKQLKTLGFVCRACL